MRVLTCLNGQEAVELVRERSFDLVLMDHMMPEMDGVEATGIIRNMNERRTLPIIALTANAVSGMKEMFLDNGFNDFISKPIDPSKLDAVLKKWIPVDKRRNTPGDGENIPESAEPPELDLPEIAGVDVAAGLAHIGGVQKRYLTLLEIFYQDAQAGLARLEREPDEASLSSFTTRVHALRSALANIGADGLSQDAALLEKAGREGDMSVIRDNLPRFREEFAALTARLGEVTARARAGDERQADPQVWEALAHLREALKAKDIDAIYAARTRLQGLPLTGAISAAVSQIADHILTMDFQQAESAVDTLLGQADSSGDAGTVFSGGSGNFIR
jgi:CheY-like chemotaxis protein